ncbi:SMI1/KNR4 family protein [Acrocarpospora phusangensis]|nr:SMI1/KNR4 family protein [Acrocarpospora phusangensis]
MPHDDLIGQVRLRAYDPAQRLRTVYVPLRWLVREYGQEASERVQHLRGNVSADPYSLDYEAALHAGASEAVAFFREAPRQPPYPPVPPADLLASEARIGCRLPELLRRVYTEIANGGFGPDYGILGITPTGHREGGGTAAEVYEAFPAVSRRLGFPVAYGGCQLYWLVSLTKQDNPVCLWDEAGWNEWEHPIEAGILLTVPSLAEWLQDWADGRDSW